MMMMMMMMMMMGQTTWSGAHDMEFCVWQVAKNQNVGMDSMLGMVCGADEGLHGR